MRIPCHPKTVVECGLSSHPQPGTVLLKCPRVLATIGLGAWDHFFARLDSKNLENAVGHRGSARPSHFVVKRKLVLACHFVPTGFWFFLLTCTGSLGLLGWGTSGE